MTILEAVKQSNTSPLFHKKSIAAAQDMLRPDETVLWALTANVCDHPVPDIYKITYKDLINVVVVVTTQRIFTVQKLVDLISSTTIPLWEIRSIEESFHRQYRNLEVKGITQYLLVQGNKKMLRPLHNAIQKALANRSAPTAQPSASANPAGLDIDQLQQLKQLYDAGILTEEEFSAKKKQILGL